MLPDEVQLIRGDLAVDDRGLLRFVNDFEFAGVRRFYLVENHCPGFTRAWHAHRREGKYILVVSGAAIVAAVRIADWSGPTTAGPVHRHVLSADKPAVLWVPPGHANGFRTLSGDARIMFFSTSSLAESRDDDVRWPPGQFGDVWTVVER